MNKKIFKELIFAFIANILGVSVWYYTGILVFSDLYEIELSYWNILSHYGIPIGFIVTFFIYLELWIHSLVMGAYNGAVNK